MTDDDVQTHLVSSVLGVFAGTQCKWEVKTQRDLIPVEKNIRVMLKAPREKVAIQDKVSRRTKDLRQFLKK